MGKKILITGGTGLIGAKLADMLIDMGYDVALLSRQAASPKSQYKTFRWDLQAGTLDEAALTYADYIIHLAGASIAREKWTEERKKVIMDSRVESARLIHQKLQTVPHHVKGFISASAIGIYGDTGDRLVTEESVYGTDFLAEVCKQWEQAARQMESLGIRSVCLRNGIVLSEKGGVLPQMAKPIKMMAGAPFGSGQQYMSWIHINDLCRLYIEAIENTTFHGAYNAVAPHPVTNEEFTRTLAKALNKPLMLPKVPAFGLRLMLGEVSGIVLGGQRVSANKVVHTGFTFEYATLEKALASFYLEE